MFMHAYESTTSSAPAKFFLSCKAQSFLQCSEYSLTMCFCTFIYSIFYTAKDLAVLFE